MEKLKEGRERTEQRDKSSCDPAPPGPGHRLPQLSRMAFTCGLCKLGRVAHL